MKALNNFKNLTNIYESESINNELNEKLITFGGKAYPKFGNVVLLAGGAGSGLGGVGGARGTAGSAGTNGSQNSGGAGGAAGSAILGIDKVTIATAGTILGEQKVIGSEKG